MVSVLRPGARGEQVIDVQTRLVTLGYQIAGDERSGTFGDGTQAAVRAFQQDRGLIVDGLVGTDTWRELVEASWRLGDRTLYLRAPHMRGDDVRGLQDRLASLGFDAGRTDGILGPHTAAALREFQKNYGLSDDGIVAAETVRALHGLPSIAGDMPVDPIRQREALRTRARGVTGLRVVLDPGHGGDDPGFVGQGGLREDEICFELANLVESALAAAGVQVHLTRRAGDGPPEVARTALANALDADLFLSLHLGGPDTKARGAASFYFGHQRWRSEAGVMLAELLLEEICSLDLVDGRAHPKTFALLRETRMPAVVVEPAFISNPDEELLLADPGFRARLATKIARAVERFAVEKAPTTSRAIAARTRDAS